MAVPGPGRDAEEGGPTVMSCSSCPGAAGVLSKTLCLLKVAKFSTGNGAP